jgi:hypothetical protein
MKRHFLRLCCVVALGVTTEVAAPSPEPSPPGTRQEVLAILRQWAVLDKKTRVLYVEPFNAQSWLVGLQFASGRSENYSVNTVTKDFGRICHH